MQGKAQACSVKDGRIRTTCTRCAKKRYVAVPAGIRKKTVRCVCGQSTLYTLNHRATPRESISGQAQLILLNGRECPVYLCDRSLGGISFNLPRQYARSVANGQDIRIKYRSMGGFTLQRKIRIKSMISNRVGAQFLDGFLPSLYSFAPRPAGNDGPFRPQNREASAAKLPLRASFYEHRVPGSGRGKEPRRPEIQVSVLPIRR